LPHHNSNISLFSVKKGLALKLKQLDSHLQEYIIDEQIIQQLCSAIIPYNESLAMETEE